MNKAAITELFASAIKTKEDDKKLNTVSMPPYQLKLSSGQIVDDCVPLDPEVIKHKDGSTETINTIAVLGKELGKGHFGEVHKIKLYTEIVKISKGGQPEYYYPPVQNTALKIQTTKENSKFHQQEAISNQKMGTLLHQRTITFEQGSYKNFLVIPLVENASHRRQHTHRSKAAKQWTVGEIYDSENSIDKQRKAFNKSFAIRTGNDEKKKITHYARMGHFDIKPENVLQSDNDEILADFGLSFKLDKNAGSRGSERFMAPELTGANFRPDEITEKVDIYSEGVMFLEKYFGLKKIDENPYTKKEKDGWIRYNRLAYPYQELSPEEVLAWDDEKLEKELDPNIVIPNQPHEKEALKHSIALALKMAAWKPKDRPNSQQIELERFKIAGILLLPEIERLLSYLDTQAVCIRELLKEKATIKADEVENQLALRAKLQNIQSTQRYLLECRKNLQEAPSRFEQGKIKALPMIPSHREVMKLKNKYFCLPRDDEKLRKQLEEKYGASFKDQHKNLDEQYETKIKKHVEELLKYIQLSKSGLNSYLCQQRKNILDHSNHASTQISLANAKSTHSPVKSSSPTTSIRWNWLKKLITPAKFKSTKLLITQSETVSLPSNQSTEIGKGTRKEELQRVKQRNQDTEKDSPEKETQRVCEQALGELIHYEKQLQDAQRYSDPTINLATLTDKLIQTYEYLQTNLPQDIQKEAAIPAL